MDEDLTLARCLLEYFEQHAKHLVRADSERGNLIKWIEFFPEYLVKDVRSVQQREFVKHLAEKGYAKSTVQSIFKTGIAAVNFAWRNEMLPNAQPFISIDKEMKKYSLPKVLRWRPLSIDDVVLMIENATTDRLVRFIMLLLATGSRPSAALELTGEQIDLNAGTINLLPGHRSQNNKYRPIVKLPSFIRAIYHEDNICSAMKHTLNQKRPMDSIMSSWNTARKNAGLDGLVTPYSGRHTMAKWLRTCGVTPWDTSGQLGHQREGSQITEIYASFDPGYLSDALEAIEGYFAILYTKCPKLQEADWLSNYELRCDLVAKYEVFIK